MTTEAITVIKTDRSEPMEFQVLTSPGSHDPDHIITLSNAQFCRLAGGLASPEAVVEAALRFLLDRIAKERIAERFDLPAIGQYFPGFELELPNYLERMDEIIVRNGAAEAAPQMGHSTVSPRA